MKRLSWTDFKSFISARSVPIHEHKVGSDYILEAYDGPISQSCKLSAESADAVDYETNYQANANPSYTDSNGVPMQRQRAFASSDNMRFRGTGVAATCTKNTTTNVDYQMTENRYINGLEFIVKNHVHGDSAKFQVVDVDNLLGYGAGLVLDEFGTDWYVAEDSNRQGPYILPYPALVNQGFYLRIIYNSTGILEDVDLKINYFLHKKG